MINYSNPFLQSLGNIRTRPQQNQFTQPQNQFNQPQNQYDFSGWGDRLGKIEEGIAGLTDQFNSFQKPGDVAPENTGNAAPEPLEQPANAPEPLGGIESLAGAPSNIGEVADVYGGGYSGLEPQPTSSAPPSPFGAQQLGRHMTYQPGQEGFTPLTAEQFAGQQDLWNQRQGYKDFSNMAAGITGLNNNTRFKMGANPSFGHAYEAWQDYAAGYGGSDPSQGMENWMQNYSFDLAPERPQFQPGSGGSLQSGFRDYQQAQLDYENSPEYQAWQQRQEARGPLSQSTIQAMGGMQHTGRPDIDPFISMGLGSPTATPTYEGYMDMVNQQAANYVPQSTTTSPNFASPGGVMQQQTGLAGYMANKAPALGGPTQQKIQQGLGALV
jgi:hypothetical protein